MIDFVTTAMEACRTYMPEDAAYYEAVKITAIIDNEEVGYCYIIPSKKQLNYIYIDERHRNKGIAHSLVEYTLSSFHITNLILWADPSKKIDKERLRKLYADFGFFNSEIMIRN